MSLLHPLSTPVQATKNVAVFGDLSCNLREDFGRLIVI